MVTWLESDITLHHNTNYYSNLDSIHILGPLATTTNLQVPEPRRIRLPQPLHEHLGFVSQSLQTYVVARIVLIGDSVNYPGCVIMVTCACCPCP